MPFRRGVLKMLKNRKGFSLIELMIVVVIIGILVAIAVPNFISMQNRAKEGSVKANMHSFQLAMEDYAVQNDGTYATTSEKDDVKALFPGGAWPKNPFTGSVYADVGFGTPPADAGEMAADPCSTTGYTIKGFGKSAILALTLSNGS